MRSRFRGFLLAVLASCPAGSAFAAVAGAATTARAAVMVAVARPAPQEQKPVDASANGVDAALAAWEEVKGKSAAMRVSALDRLAGFDDARVTDILLAELKAQGVSMQARHVLDLIAQRPRGNIVADLREVLLRADAPPTLRQSAARALARQGNLGVDLLADIARNDGGDNDARLIEACELGLAAAGEDRAWRALATLATRGSNNDQLRRLRLMRPARGVGAVTAVRLKLVQDADVVIAATAWNGLAADGHSRAASLFEDLVERVGPKPPPAACAEFVAGMAWSLPEDQFPVFLRFASVKDPAVRGALRDAAPALGKREALVRWLVTSALESSEPDERDTALLVLRHAPAASLQSLLAKVRAGLRRPSRDTLEQAIALNELLGKDPTWKDDVLALLKHNDAEVRTFALSMLLELGVGDGVEAAQRCTTAKEWALRSAAFRYLTKFRDLKSIPVLIARADREQGRLDSELSDALFVHTGVRCWTKSEWVTWWNKNQATHQLPAPESVRITQATGGGGGAATVAYYGIPLVSKRATFLIDISGSMNAKIGTDRKRSRLDEAKRQLKIVLESLGEQHQFNVVPYESTTHPVFDALRKAKKGDKQEAIEKVEALITSGGTNIFEALQLAFADPDVDTVYLLSDGNPSVGRITDVDDLADEIKRWNYSRQIVVHGIAVGGDSPLLRRLARESGGQYVFVR